MEPGKVSIFRFFGGLLGEDIQVGIAHRIGLKPERIAHRIDHVFTQGGGHKAFDRFGHQFTEDPGVGRILAFGHKVADGLTDQGR